MSKDISYIFLRPSHKEGNVTQYLPLRLFPTKRGGECIYHFWPVSYNHPKCSQKVLACVVFTQLPTRRESLIQKPNGIFWNTSMDFPPSLTKTTIFFNTMQLANFKKALNLTCSDCKWDREESVISGSKERQLAGIHRYWPHVED